MDLVYAFAQARQSRREDRMRVRLTPVVLLIAAAAVAIAAAQAPPPARPAAPLTVHEWGTFTSIAGEDGRAVEWRPQAGPERPALLRRAGRFNVKGTMSGTVRMETPVLYFYAPRELTVNVTVRFRQGAVTEWFPQAAPPWRCGPARAFDSTITWNDVRVSPRRRGSSRTSGASHYYTARNTDATPLEAGIEAEKFLFYRGVGAFDPPITAPSGRRKDRRLDAGGQPIGDVMLFENRGGAIAYDVRHDLTGRRPRSIVRRWTTERPAARGAGTDPRGARSLSEGSRRHGRHVARLVVRGRRAAPLHRVARDVDAILPLTMTPAPPAVARVFVGRIELVTPVTRRDVRLALATGDRPMLQKYGRFLKPIGDRVLAEVSPLDRDVMADRLKAVAASWEIPASSCR